MKEKDAKVIENFLLNFNSDSTKRSYRCHIRKYFEVIGVNNPDTYFNNGRNYETDVKTFAQTLQKKPPLSQKTIMACIKAFLSDNEVDLKTKVWKNINNRIRGSGPVTDNVRPTNEQLKQILQHADIKSKALFLTISSSGMRVGESLQLTFDDIDIENRTITIPGEFTKNGNKCITYFTEEAKDAIMEWLKVRDEYLKNSYYKSKYVRDRFAKQGIIIEKDEKLSTYNIPVWKITKDGKEIDSNELIKDENRVFPFSAGSVIQNMWNHLLEKSGLNEKETDRRLKYPRYKYHIHTLRKFFTTNMTNDAVPETFVDKYVNHKERYNGAYTPATLEELKQMYDNHCNCLTVFSETYKVQKEIKPKLDAQDTAITELVKKNRELEEQIKDLTKVYEHDTTTLERQYETKLEQMNKRIEQIAKAITT